MPDTKISALTALGATPAATDMIPLVDVSDTSMAESGTTKRVAYSDLVPPVDLSAYLTTAVAAATYSLLGHDHSGVYQPLDTQLTALAGLAYASNALKVIRVNAGENGFELVTPSSGVTDHGALDGASLIDDDHTQYALLAGRSGGQTHIGGTGSGESLTLRGTSHNTPGPVVTLGTHAVRLIGGTTSQQVEISHDGTTGLLKSASGKLVFDASGGFSNVEIDYFGQRNFSYNGGAGLSLLDTAGDAALKIYTNSGLSVGSCYLANSTRHGSGHRIKWMSSTVWHSGSADTEIFRAAAGVVGVGDGSTGGGILEFPQVASGGTPSTNSARVFAKDVAGTAEMHVRDEAGNETQISPHAMDGPASLYDLTDSPPHVVKEINHFIGGVRYLNVSRTVFAMEELLQAIKNGATLAQIRTNLQAKPAGALNLYHVETFAQHNTRTGSSFVKLNWDTVQNELQAAYDAAREQEQAAHTQWVADKAAHDQARAAEIVAHEAWEQEPEDTRGDEPAVRPEGFPQAPTILEARDIRKPKPAWLAERGG